MKKFNQDHTIDYILLISILITTTLAIRFIQSDKSTLFITSAILSIIYVAWGILHHKKAGHIDKMIVLEYSGIAILVNILIISLLI